MRTGRRIEKGEHQPQKGKSRDWRTREDPLESVWESELKPLLISQPELRPMTLWEYLQEKYPGQYGRSILRTLQRRSQYHYCSLYSLHRSLSINWTSLNSTSLSRPS